MSDESSTVPPPPPNNKLFNLLSNQKLAHEYRQKCIEKDLYIQQLEEILKQHELQLPCGTVASAAVSPSYRKSVGNFALSNGGIDEITSMIQEQKKLLRNFNYAVEFHDLHFTTKAYKDRTIASISSIISSLVCFWNGKGKEEVEILSHATGRILPGKMTLLIGPPGSGKSVLLRALAGRLRELGGAKFSGDVYYDGDNVKSGKFKIGKVADYIEQGDTLSAVLSVEETLKFAWMCTTGGHHSYARAKDSHAAEVMNKDDANFVLVQNMLTGLGLKGCKDTLVGNGMIRGVSGGQKRRVTVGEMLACPRPIKLMDCISNGLDTATTFDIVRALQVINRTLAVTSVISLLQPPPDVYRLFDEIILLSEGHIVYHGPREQAVEYFAALGYTCPSQVDEADFLQELPNLEGRRFITKPEAPRTAKALAAAWKQSELYRQLLSEMKYPSLEDAKTLEHASTKEWHSEQKEDFAGSFWYYLKICLERQMKVVTRDSTFIKARVGQCLVVGAIAGSLFNNISTTDVTTMNGFLFNTMLFSALGSFAILPIVYDQKAVFYKQKDALFFPTAAYSLAQTVSFFPLQVVEAILYTTIVYWSAGLSEDYDGSRFLTFIVISLTFSMTVSQLFRLVGSFVADLSGALPICGIIVVVMVLFSGFIQPKAIISDGWIWFYWMNPVAWALKAVTVNEFTSPKYDFLTCTDPTCSSKARFGDFVLKQYGNPTEEVYTWYSVAVLIGEYLFLFLLTYFAMQYFRTEPVPPAPMRIADEDLDQSGGPDSIQNSSVVVPVMDEQLPFDAVSFAFKDIWYTVTLPNGEDVDLLKGVNGYFEPGTVTALMGSSGAGKTTLLDVLAGRKNTGVVKGEMFLNGTPKMEAYFRKIMGYVEQFDTLPPKSTAREAIAFSAALRLAPSITRDQRKQWVNSVIDMMDLQIIENQLIGKPDAGMSFEQRKRVSIGVELAANPSILFLDEPTTGLDSRAAQALIVNIRKIAASGRSVVCTIHQPSTAIFNEFDSLLLLQRGGQTVFFGELGEKSSNLVDFLQQAPGVEKIPAFINPATWMLDVIGAGTNTSNITATDFHAYYNASNLSKLNLLQLDTLMQPNEGSRKLTEEDTVDTGDYNASSWRQFSCLMHRIALTYWRTPNYSLVRHFVNIIIALIFASAYPLQEYNTYVAAMSRAAVIYITAIFCGVLAMLNIIPVLSAERPAFYREQQSRMYSVWVYTLTLVLVELPYLLVASLSFTLPFFYIVGFDNVGDKIGKFFWYWFFQFLWQGTMLSLGSFYVALTPNEATTQVLGGVTNTVLGLFCGFLIAEQNFPTFWLFMYWINPLHYVLEGLIMSQFHGDTTMIRVMDGSQMTAEAFMTQQRFTTWSYDHVGYDVLALGIFASLAILGNYLSLSFIRHDKR